MVGVVLLVVTGCAQTVTGRASAVPTPGTAAIAAPPVGDPTDVTTVLQDFWRQAYPAAFGRPWRDIRRFVPVHPADRSEPTPPCVNHATDLDGQAFYCPTADAVVWDADGLLPRIRDEFGAAGVVVVLAHEVGHAVQTRLGIDAAQARDPARYPTILLEAMSDCYAGATMAYLAQHPVAGLSLGTEQRDTALRALVGFRDPVGIGPSDASAHGNAFDRVSAFQDGWTGGPTLCAAMTVAGRAFTERRFGSAADQARGGNLPLAQLLAAVGNDARSWFAALAAPKAPASGGAAGKGPSSAPSWRAPALRYDPGSACPRADLTAQGPASFCAADGSLFSRPCRADPNRGPVRRLRRGHPGGEPLRPGRSQRDEGARDRVDSRLPRRGVHGAADRPGELLHALPRRPRRGRSGTAHRRLGGTRRRGPRRPGRGRVRPGGPVPRRGAPGCRELPVLRRIPWIHGERLRTGRGPAPGAPP